MKLTGIFVALFLSLSSIVLAQNVATRMDSVSYSLGVLIAKNLKANGVKDLNVKVLTDAIDDVLSGREVRWSEDECKKIFSDFSKSMQEKTLGEVKKAGIQYLEENAKKKGVVTTKSGLQYEILKSGEGPQPKETDRVKVHYHGTLIDGTVFDSSVDRGEPITFPVNGVIKGWQEALQMMHVGDKWRIVIPYDLAYGDRGAGSIKPYETLIFEVELLGIE